MVTAGVAHSRGLGRSPSRGPGREPRRGAGRSPAKKILSAVTAKTRANSSATVVGRRCGWSRRACLGCCMLQMAVLLLLGRLGRGLLVLGTASHSRKPHASARSTDAL